LQLLAKKFIFNFMKDFVEQLNLQIGVYWNNKKYNHFVPTNKTS
jgi:hypothetical protein